MEKIKIKEIDKLNHYKEEQKSLNLLYYPFYEYTGKNLLYFYIKDLVTIFEKRDDPFDLQENRENNLYRFFFFLFSLKFGNNSAIDLMKNKELNDDNKLDLFDLRERVNSFLKTRICSDKKLINFCININNHIPEDTPSFDEIYIYIKNMINNMSNVNIREKIFAFQDDNKKFILELQKYDIVNNLEQNIIKSKNKKFNFKKKSK